MEKITQNVRVETDYFGANVGIIQTTQGLVLIDTPMNPSDQDRLLRETSSLGAIHWIIPTDHHLDHFMGASFLPGMVVSHKAVRGKFLSTFGPVEKILERVSWSDPAGAERVKKLIVKEPAITFEGALSLYLDPVEIHLESFVGHTPHTLAVRVEPDGVLFTGDNVVNEFPPFFHEAEDATAWVESLQKLKQLPFSILVPGHGPVADGGAVDGMIKNVGDVIDRVNKALGKGLSEKEITDQLQYMDALRQREVNPEQRNFYRIQEKRGIANIIRALKNKENH
jgi:glyoxylase-like metal-dependent hydrolase (beta-lactamase superfamily II)